MDLYAWPGNIRELENLIYREYLLSDSPVIDIAPPSDCGAQRRTGSDRRPNDVGSLDFTTAKSQAIAEFERRYLSDVLAVARGNVTKAASLVGKERRAFGKLLKKHGIDKDRYCR